VQYPEKKGPKGPKRPKGLRTLSFSPLGLFGPLGPLVFLAGITADAAFYHVDLAAEGVVVGDFLFDGFAGM